MVKVNSSDYPRKRNWESKVFAMPNIPRGDGGFPRSLKYILNSIKNNEHPNNSVNIPGSNSKSTLEKLYINLRPSGIVNNSSTGWEISPVGEKWLETEDNLYLGAIFDANIKYLDTIYNSMTPKVKESMYGVELKDFLEERRELEKQEVQVEEQ